MKKLLLTLLALVPFAALAKYETPKADAELAACKDEAEKQAKNFVALEQEKGQAFNELGEEYKQRLQDLQCKTKFEEARKQEIHEQATKAKDAKLESREKSLSTSKDAQKRVHQKQS